MLLVSQKEYSLSTKDTEVNNNLPHAVNATRYGFDLLPKAVIITST